MPSALETLVKILKLEQDMGYQDKAVIGGLRSFAVHWSQDAHAQAKKPEHHVLVDEITGLLNTYGDLPATSDRHNTIKHIIGRITGRVPAGTTPGESARPAEKEPASTPVIQPSPPPPAEPVEVQKPAAEPPPPEFDLEPVPVPARQAEPAAPDVSGPARMARPPRRKRGAPPDSATLRAAINSISGIGPKMSATLAQLGIQSIEDWLYFFPRRYDDYSHMLPLNALQPGMDVTVIGTVRQSTMIKGQRGLDVLMVTIDDGTSTLTAYFFGQPYLRSKLERGVQVVFSGKTDIYRGRIKMDNPEWEFLETEALHTRSIIPIYPLTKGLSAHAMRRLSRRVIDRWVSQVPDYMPETVLERVDLADLNWALRQIHFPESWEALALARRRLTFDELILLQLAVLRNRREWQSRPGVALHVPDEWLNAALQTLPYTLTDAQARALQAIREDLAREVPMNRLLQGDVGAGKTVVAATAMAIAVANGYQAAIMAPTSILAEQHYKSISSLIQNFPGGEAVNVKLLTGATPAQERAGILAELDDGSLPIVVGTHALIQEGVSFARLGLAVVDEQHRFGVEQRGKLRGKGINPHVLVMTATPIPRTLALTMYADLDLTVLDEMPPGRIPVHTRVLLPRERERVYSFIRSQIEKGRQAFIVYPLVDASERESLADVGAAVKEYERLQNEIFPNRRLGLLHGRLSAAQKDMVMTAFGRGELDILVSTSVVEVGIDVPNATAILIEGANRFGLAQLHQLRGRVGRGEYSSTCVLIPDDENANNARLQVMESTSDGFKLAEMDWELRGAGDLLGTRQSGGRARLAEFMDVRLVEEAQIEARTLYEEDSTLALPEHAALREQVYRRFGVDGMADVS